MKTDEAELADLQKALDAKKTSMEQKKITNQEELDQIKAIRLQIATSRKALPAQAEAETSAPVDAAPATTSPLPQPLTDVVRMMQALLDSVKTLPDLPVAAQQQMQTLQTTINSSIAPMMTDGSVPPTSTQFGPALQNKPSAAAGAHPYAEANSGKQPAWGDAHGDDS